MVKSKPIDLITDNVVKVIDKRFLDNKVPQVLLDYLYLATTGLCISLGTKYVDDIFNAINNIVFVKKIKIDTDKKYVVLPTFDSDLKIKYQLYIKDISEGNIEILEFIIKEIVNILCIGGINTDVNNKLISEVLKSLETEDVINILVNLHAYDFINTKFRDAIDCFKDLDRDYYSINSYANVVNLFRPLYKYESLKELLISNLINGHYENIYQEFDEVLGNNSFITMIESLRAINRKLMRKNIPTYEIACSYLNIRNKFIQNYISL